MEIGNRSSAVVTTSKHEKNRTSQNEERGYEHNEIEQKMFGGNKEKET